MTAKSPPRRLLPPEFAPPFIPCNLAVRRCSVPRAQASRRILIMRLGAHGDILMATPLLSALRAAWPDAHITWIVERKEREAIDASPDIDELLLWDGGYWKTMLRRGLFPRWLARALQFQRLVRQNRYDVFISLQPEEWPLLTRAVQSPLAVGVFDTFRQFYHNRPTSAYTRLYKRAFTHADLPPHRTDQYLLPLEALDIAVPDAEKAMSMGFLQEDRDVVEDFLRAQPVDPAQPLVVLAPMTTWPSRCWPSEWYAQLGDLLAEQGMGVILIGSAKERAAVQAVADGMRSAPVLAAGVFGFRQMAALIASASLLVSGDTGPMHVAAAVGTPYLALFGSTPPEGRMPLAGRGIVLRHPIACSPCDQKVCPLAGEAHMRCMRLISVSEVMQAAECLLVPAQAV